MNQLDKLINQELIGFSGQTFSDSEGVQNYIKGMLERIVKVTRERDIALVEDRSRERCGVDDSLCDENGDCLKCGNEGYPDSPQEIIQALHNLK